MMKKIRVAKIIVLNQANQALILQIGEWLERPDKSHQPDLPGGEVEEGEDAQQAASRELKEETGLDIKPAEFVQIFNDISEGKDLNVERFVFAVRALNPSITLSFEHEDYKWVDLDELGTIKMREPYPHVFDLLVRNKLHGLV